MLARDSGKAMISGRMQLDHDGRTGYGFLMIRPVYQHGVVPESVEARRQQLKGFMLGENNLNAFFGEALFDSAHESLSLWVYDQDAPDSKVLLFSRDISERNAAEISSAGWLLSGHDMEWKVNTEQYGRHWIFMFKPAALFMQSVISWRSWLVLVSGIMMTLLVLFFVYRGQRYTAMIEQKAMLLAQEKDESELRYLRLFESNNDALFVLEIDEEHGPGKFKDVNKAMCQRLGYSKEELLQMSPMDINLPEEKKELQTCLEKVLQHKVHLFDTVHMTKGGKEIPVEINIQVLDGFNERMFIGCARDIGERRKAHEKQIEAKEWEMTKLSSAVDQTADSIMITDRNGIIEYANPAFVDITGYSRDEAQGKTPGIFKSGHNTSDDYKQLWQTILNGEVYRNVLVNRKKDGTLYYEEKTISPLKDCDGNITHFISSGKDITERMQTEERLHHLAYHDILTDLPNRALFIERINTAINQSSGKDNRCAVLFIDLDNFKNINDTLGHGVGDLLLQAVPSRLLSCVRKYDTVARFGGDEFSLLLERLPNSQVVAKMAKKLIAILSEPYTIQNQTLYLTASIGISLSPDDSTDASTLIKNADTAMYRAKDTGRNNYQFYSTEMGTRAIERLSLETSLRVAMERDEFELYYQPQVSLHSGRIIGAEALIRWHHPELGLVVPDKFIPLLEETGLIIEVGMWVLNTACKHGAAIISRTGEPFRMAVNFSGKQFRDNALTEIVGEAIETNQFPAPLLDVEITETVLMQSDNYSLENISGLKALGVQLSIDDFGTGYSSLSYLKRFPVDIIKIDRAFVNGVTDNPEDAAIVTAVIAMAHSLKLKVVAEGVETQEQVEFLREYACDYLQGYLFSKPVSEKEFNALLAKQDEH